MISNITLSIENFATLAGTLANGGICPETEERVFQDPEAVKNCLSQMAMCGMNTYSGQWNFKIGLPAKSGFSGVTIMVVPNVMGVAVWSPLLDKHYNSHKGEIFFERFVDEFHYHSLKYTYGFGAKQEMDEEDHMKNLGMNFIFHSQQGNIRALRRAIANGIDINFQDYDQRTALMLAAAEGHTEIVKYLVAHGADKDMRDLHKRTALDEAKGNGHEEVVAVLGDE